MTEAGGAFARTRLHLLLDDLGRAISDLPQRRRRWGRRLVLAGVVVAHAFLSLVLSHHI